MKDFLDTTLAFVCIALGFLALFGLGWLIAELVLWVGVRPLVAPF